MEEARNILALNSVGTPLKGGQNVAIVGGTGSMGAQTISRTVSTPNPMASAGTPMGTPGATPLMRLTQTQSGSVQGGRRGQGRHPIHTRAHLRPHAPLHAALTPGA
jgi:hypothetical protein